MSYHLYSCFLNWISSTQLENVTLGGRKNKVSDLTFGESLFQKYTSVVAFEFLDEIHFMNRQQNFNFTTSSKS